MKHLYFFLALFSAFAFCSCSDGDDESYGNGSYMDGGYHVDYLHGNAPFNWKSTPEYIPSGPNDGKNDRLYREFQVPAEGGKYVFECTNYKEFTFKQDIEWADICEPYELRFMHLHATISGKYLTVEISPLTEEDKSSGGYNKFYPFAVHNDNAYFIFSFNQVYVKWDNLDNFIKSQP